jgi:hypothetical protein
MKFGYIALSATGADIALEWLIGVPIVMSRNPENFERWLAQIFITSLNSSVILGRKRSIKTGSAIGSYALISRS